MSSVTETFEPICVQRILVSLDSSRHSYAALNAAVDLARHYQADLIGVFVEDSTVLDLARMPFGQEVGGYTAVVHEISHQKITRSISIQSRSVVRTFHRLLNQTMLQGAISVRRGKVLETIRKESEDCDLLIVGKAGTNPVLRRRLGSTARGLIEKQDKSLMLLEEENRLGYPLIALYDDSPLGWIGLETGRDLLDSGETLVILMDDSAAEAFQKQHKKVSEWAKSSSINISIQGYKPHRFGRFLQIIDGVKTGLLILPHLSDPEKNQIIQRCLDEVSLPVLLIQPNDLPIDVD
jgi:nucleotide-binding universal stress UspA family protein